MNNYNYLMLAMTVPLIIILNNLNYHIYLFLCVCVLLFSILADVSRLVNYCVNIFTLKCNYTETLSYL